MRKALILFQYSLSLLLIVCVSLGLRQYQYSLAFDLGLTTKNIINIDMQQSKPDLVMDAFAALPEVKQISKSMYVSSTGTTWTGYFRYNDPQDSTVLVYNYIDSAYLAVHQIPLLAGRTFNANPSGNSHEAGIIINEKALAWLGIKDPHDAIGEEVHIDAEKLTIIGVVRNFHHNTLNNPINNFAFRYFGDLPRRWGGFANLSVQSDDLPGLMKKIEVIWKKIDPVHPVIASFYEEKIKNAYREMAGSMKIMGFLAFLAISIASLGLLGMVVFTTETRLKEICIRKVVGATEVNLILLMSRGFLVLLAIAVLIAVPAGYFFVQNVMLEKTAFRAPVGFLDLFAGVLIVLGIAFLAVSSQTLRVARVNPAITLRNE